MIEESRGCFSAKRARRKYLFKVVCCDFATFGDRPTMHESHQKLRIVLETDLIK